MWVQILKGVKLPLRIDHWHLLTPLVNEHHAGDLHLLAERIIICTEGGCYVDDASTILRGDEVSRHHPQCSLIGLYPGEELLVSQPYEVSPLVSGDDAVGHHLAPLLGGLHRQLLALRTEVGGEAWLRHHDGDRLEGVGIECLHRHIVDPAADSESHIGGKCPWGGGPGSEVGGPVTLQLLGGIDDLH